MASANASLAMLDEMEEDANEMELYKRLGKNHARNREILDQRHESFPDKEAADIIQDDEEFMPNVGNVGSELSEDNADGVSSSDNAATPTVVTKSSAQRTVWVKHFPKTYMRGLKAVTGFAYQKIVEPSALLKERDYLIAQLGTELFTKEKGARLKQIETEIKLWETRRKEALDAATIDEEDAKTIGELSADIMAAKGKEIDPSVLLAILLLAPVLNVTFISITHFFMYRMGK